VGEISLIKVCKLRLLAHSLTRATMHNEKGKMSLPLHDALVQHSSKPIPYRDLCTHWDNWGQFIFAECIWSW